MPQAEYGDPNDTAPYKRYPGTRDYFAPQVEEALFPRASGPKEEGGRWIRRPVMWRVGVNDGQNDFELAVDLLEIVRVPLKPYIAYGLAHVTLAGTPDAVEMLACSRALLKRYRATEAVHPLFEFRVGARAERLEGNHPLAAVATALFGGAHSNAGEQTYVFAAAGIPDEVPEDDVPAWRRALAQGEELARAREVLTRDPKHDEHRMMHMGPTLATFFGRTALHTYNEHPAGALRNVRSYWSETVLFALVQHAYIETYAAELARLGGRPLGPELDDLFVRWLAFRNTLWWQHPSFTTPVPRRVLRRAQGELKTAALYDDLATGFTTYVEARRHRSEDVESQALRALQVYGAAFAIVSTVASVLQVLGQDYVDTDREELVYGLGLAGLGLVVILTVTAWIRRREGRLGQDTYGSRSG